MSALMKYGGDNRKPEQREPLMLNLIRLCLARLHGAGAEPTRLLVSRDKNLWS